MHLDFSSAARTKSVRLFEEAPEGCLIYHFHFLINNCISRPDLFIAGAGPGQVKPEAPAESPGRGGVVLRAPLHLVELHDHVPGVEDPGPGPGPAPGGHAA